MYAGFDFDSIEPGEVDVFSMEFTNQLQYGNTIASAAWTCSVEQTIPGATPDLAPASRINGPAGVVTFGPRSFTSQTVSGMIDGTTTFCKPRSPQAMGASFSNTRTSFAGRLSRMHDHPQFEDYKTDSPHEYERYDVRTAKKRGVGGGTCFISVRWKWLKK